MRRNEQTDDVGTLLGFSRRHENIGERVAEQSFTGAVDDDN